MRRLSTTVLAFGFLGSALMCVYLDLNKLREEQTQIDSGIFAFKAGHYECADLILEPHAQRGDPAASLNLGMMYAFGLGVPRNRSRAQQLLRESTVAKYSMTGDMYLSIARSYETGDKVPADKQEALAWYRIAADAGSGEARQHLKSMHGSPRSALPKPSR